MVEAKNSKRRRRSGGERLAKSVVGDGTGADSSNGVEVVVLGGSCGSFSTSPGSAAGRGSRGGIPCWGFDPGLFTMGGGGDFSSSSFPWKKKTLKRIRS